MKHHQYFPFPPTHRIMALFAACSSITFAQTTPITGDLTVSGTVKSGSSTGGTELRLGGLVIAKGLYGGQPTLASTDQGAGTRILWYPGKAAFRAGRVTGNQWDDLNIANGSVAFGFNSIASGSYAIAMGQSNMASGDNAVAMGSFSYAMNGSIALGNYNLASGVNATALGYETSALGGWSTAMGILSSAIGKHSTAMGEGTSAYSLCSTAIGRYNVGDGDHLNWNPGDPLFEIGNGIPPNYENDEPTPASRSNALTVYKNGNMDVQGVVTCAPGGNIPMFTGN